MTNSSSSEKEGLLQASSAPLAAASFVIEDACSPINDFFMLCKAKCPDPFSCLPLGLAVKQCVRRVLQRIEASPCAPQFVDFWHCLDYNSQMLMYCREEEEKFYQCAAQNGLGKKRLWRGDSALHPAGFKEPGEFPEKDNFWYKWHVYNYKYQYPKYNSKEQPKEDPKEEK